MHTSVPATQPIDTPSATYLTEHDGAFVTIPDAHFLFHADFKRGGSDLTLTGEDGHRVVVPGYFKHEHLPTLLSPEGAALTGDVVEALVGSQAPDQYAQAGTPVQTSPLAIGRVALVEGGATAYRNGLPVALNTGDVVLKGDVIQTGANSAVGVAFSDGTSFNLSSNARMVLNEFVYSPGGSANAAVINLVQGAITFVAGQVARTGDMKVGTPVALMGIRGTAVNVNIRANDGATDISVMAEGDNLIHMVQVYALPTATDLAAGRFVGVLLGSVTNYSGTYSFTPTPTGLLVEETGKDAATLQAELAIVQAVFLTQSVGALIMQQQPLPAPNSHSAGTQITTAPFEYSTTKIEVNVTTTPTGVINVTDVQVVPPSAGTPAVLPFIPPPQSETQSHAPVVAQPIADQSSSEDAAWTFQVPANAFSDADGDSLSFTATLANGDPLPAWMSFNPTTLTFSGTPPLNFNGVIKINVTASDGAQTVSDTFKLTIDPVNDAPKIHRPHDGIHYWAENTIGNVSVINHISFSDVDAGTLAVRVTFAVNDSGDVLTACNLPAGLLVSHNGSSELTLEGSIADINAYLFGGNLQWNPAGCDDHEMGLLTLTIDDNSGGVVGKTVLISEICAPDFCGDSSNDFSQVNFSNVCTVYAGDGCDTITTSWNHQGTATIYDGGDGFDTIHLVFTPDQLAEILADCTMRQQLTDFVDHPCGRTLDLCGSSWNAKVEYFERADVNIVTGYGSGVFFDVSGETEGAEFIIGTSAPEELNGCIDRNNVVVGLGGDDRLVGGMHADALFGGAGNDIIIGGLGNDVLSGSTGSDTFVFTERNGEGAANFGKDTIVDFHLGEDKIDIHADGFTDIAALLQATLGHDCDGNAVITLGVDNSITLAGITEAAVIAHQNSLQLVA
jgi:hypothetical protein